jgi:hypothetical protein
MLCRTARRMIFLYKSGELSQAETSRLEKHLGGCSACAAEVMAARRTGRMVVALREREPILHNPEGLTAGIMRDVELARTHAWSDQRLHMPSAGIWRLQLACSAALLFIVVALVAQTYSDARKVYALEQRLCGEGKVQAASAALVPGQLLAELPNVPNLLGLIQQFGQSNSSSRTTLLDHIAENYPGLASINLDDGIDERERAILATEGETLLRELESIVRTGGKDYAK